MEIEFPGLYASAPQPLPFAPSLDIRAFLLEREQGNFLIYASPTVEPERQRIESLGGISRHYLNHGHESGFGCEGIAKTFGAPLFCHENERESVAGRCSVDGVFSERAMIDDDFELIPTPGHTTGATAFL